jgi:hypothetical protein
VLANYQWDTVLDRVEAALDEWTRGLGAERAQVGPGEPVGQGGELVRGRAG